MYINTYTHTHACMLEDLVDKNNILFVLKIFFDASLSLLSSPFAKNFSAFENIGQNQHSLYQSLDASLGFFLRQFS